MQKPHEQSLLNNIIQNKPVQEVKRSVIDLPKNSNHAMLGSGLASAIGTAAINYSAPGSIIGVTSAMSGVAGAVSGKIIAQGRDTLVKSSLVPAGIVAAGSIPTNMLIKYVNPDFEGEVDPIRSGVISAGIGSGLWAARNWNKKKKYY